MLKSLFHYISTNLISDNRSFYRVAKLRLILNVAKLTMWEFADSFVDFIQINSNLCFEFFRDRAKFNQDLVSLTSYPSPTLLILPSLSLVLLPFVWKETETARRAKQSEELFNSKGLAIAYVLKQRLWKFRKWIIFRKTFVGLWWGRQILMQPN